MSKKAKPLHDEMKTFVRWHLGKGAFAPLTGQDWPAWIAFVHLLQCYSHGGGDHAIAAMRATVRCAQPTIDVLACFVQAVPGVLDWSNVKELWPRVAEGIKLRRYGTILAGDRTGDNATLLHAVERIGDTMHSDPLTVWHNGVPIKGFVQYGALESELRPGAR